MEPGIITGAYLTCKEVLSDLLRIICQAANGETAEGVQQDGNEVPAVQQGANDVLVKSNKVTMCYQAKSNQVLIRS